MGDQLRVLAYGALSRANDLRECAGVPPITCPPTTANVLRPAALSGYELIVLALRGGPEDTVWLGDDAEPGLTVDQVIGADLTGTTVLVLDGVTVVADSPMLVACLKAGAVAVAAAEYNAQRFPEGPSAPAVVALATWFRRFIQSQTDPWRALWLAKRALQPASVIVPNAVRAFRLFDQSTSTNKEFYR